jgi:peptidoglycan/xylan/chitin deacetylase (PgdA/CDA1 family)
MPINFPYSFIEASCKEVLLYHHITRTGNEKFSISQKIFHKQMQWLVDNKYKIQTLGQWDVSCPEQRRVFITFDDGYEDIYQYAFPVLQEFGSAASIFLITDYIGKTNDWEHKSLPSYLHLNETQILHLCSKGWEMNSHTASHGNFINMTDKEILSDVCRAKETLQQWNKGPLFCAFPAGRSEPRLVKALQDKDYSGAFVAESGWSNENRFHLPRLPVTCNSLTDFVCLFKEYE